MNFEVEPLEDFEATADFGTTGLVGTIGVRIIDNVGNTVLARTTAGIIEDPAASGLYQVTLTAPDTVGQYSIVWDDAADHWAIDELSVLVDVGEEIGQAGTSLIGPCTNWVTGAEVMACCSIETTDETLFDSVITQAQEMLFELSGRQFSGVCSQYARPCRTACGCGWQVLSRGYVVNWRGDGWYCETDPCGCASIPTVYLSGYPVRVITEVKIDGAAIPVDTYKLVRNRELWRVRDPADPDTPLSWPGCQNLDLEDDQQGTFSVSYVAGLDPPAIGKAAATQLACELYKQCAGQECDLPKGVTRITRQGVVFEKPAFAGYARENGVWATGMSLVDAFLNSYNPAGLIRRPTVWSPASPPRFAVEA